MAGSSDFEPGSGNPAPRNRRRNNSGVEHVKLFLLFVFLFSATLYAEETIYRFGFFGTSYHQDRIFERDGITRPWNENNRYLSLIIAKRYGANEYSITGARFRNSFYRTSGAVTLGYKRCWSVCFGIELGAMSGYSDYIDSTFLHPDLVPAVYLSASYEYEIMGETIGMTFGTVGRIHLMGLTIRF